MTYGSTAARGFAVLQAGALSDLWQTYFVYFLAWKRLLLLLLAVPVMRIRFLWHCTSLDCSRAI